MKYYYFDSSALVKRYAPEKGTDRVDGIFQEKDRVLIIANIGIVAIYSAHLSLALDLKALKVILVSSDHILNQAAIAENITTINPENQNALPCP